MRKLRLSTVIVLALIISATTGAARNRSNKDSSARYTPPPETGQIFTVINYSIADGRAQHTPVSISWGSNSRTLIVPPPGYGSSCATSSPSGFVLRLRHSTPDSVPLVISTPGKIVRAPYQGDPPLELLHACYKLQ
jgi:hypothetical protein